jgi:hypothetical protein
MRIGAIHVFLLQIAPPSRGEVHTYETIRERLDELSGRINGEFAEIDWVPIRYVNQGYDRADLAGFYRAAQIGLITPLRDGMNLVAKEYVAAQDPEDPGVLILSRFAGRRVAARGRATGQSLLQGRDQRRDPGGAGNAEGGTDKALDLDGRERPDRGRGLLAGGVRDRASSGRLRSNGREGAGGPIVLRLETWVDGSSSRRRAAANHRQPSPKRLDRTGRSEQMRSPSSPSAKCLKRNIGA